MSVPRPTAWPTVFPPQGGYDEVAAIAAYLNEAIDAARARYNARRDREGRPRLITEYEWEGAHLPRYPANGWSTRTDVPPYQHIGPNGLGGFGLHEFQGDPEIVERRGEMMALAIGVPYVPPVVEPPPPVELPPAPAPVTDPAPIDTACPEGQYFNSFTNRCEANVSAPADTSFRVGAVRVSLDVYDERLPQVRFGIPVDLGNGTIGFKFSHEGSLQVFVTVLDGRPVNGKWWVMSCGLTDVACGIVAAHDSGAERDYLNKQGVTFPTTLDTGAF